MKSSVSRRRRVLLFSTLLGPFIADDERHLRKWYDVTAVTLSGWRALVRIPLLVARNELLFIWFGSVYSGLIVLLGRLSSKPTVIVIGGVDASKDPEIQYGIWLTWWKVPFVRYAFRHASRLLTVDPSLGEAAVRLAEYDGRNIEYLPTGYDPLSWIRTGVPREKMILCVASCENRWRVKKKGIDKLIRAAQELADVRFLLVGIHAPFVDELRRECPANMEIVPRLPRHELPLYYARAKVYCQPSFTEGLPNTLCEAMLGGCIPVGTLAGGIPTAIGDAGFLVDYRDQQALVRALRQALDAPPSLGEQARDRIRTLFPEQRREEGLRRTIDALLPPPGPTP